MFAKKKLPVHRNGFSPTFIEFGNVCLAPDDSVNEEWLLAVAHRFCETTDVLRYSYPLFAEAAMAAIFLFRKEKIETVSLSVIYGLLADRNSEKLPFGAQISDELLCRDFFDKNHRRPPYTLSYNADSSSLTTCLAAYLLSEEGQQVGFGNKEKVRLTEASQFLINVNADRDRWLKEASRQLVSVVGKDVLASKAENENLRQNLKKLENFPKEREFDSSLPEPEIDKKAFSEDQPEYFSKEDVSKSVNQLPVLAQCHQRFISALENFAVQDFIYIRADAPKHSGSFALGALKPLRLRTDRNCAAREISLCMLFCVGHGLTQYSDIRELLTRKYRDLFIAEVVGEAGPLVSGGFMKTAGQPPEEFALTKDGELLCAALGNPYCDLQSDANLDAVKKQCLALLQ